MVQNSDDTRLVTILLIIIGAIVILPMVFMGFGVMGFGSMMGGGMWGNGMWGGGTMSGWMVFAGLVMQLLFLAALVGGGYLVYRAVVDTGSGSDKALEELQLAYARGELTDDEYEKRRATLERDTESQ